MAVPFIAATISLASWWGSVAVASDVPTEGVRVRVDLVGSLVCCMRCVTGMACCDFVMTVTVTMAIFWGVMPCSAA